MPLRTILCGLVLRLSLRIMVPDLVPTAVGAKITLMAQLAPTGIVTPQVLVCE